MPDYSRIKQSLEIIYGPGKSEEAWSLLEPVLEKAPRQPSKRAEYFSQQDVMLITYGDSLLREGEKPLAALNKFAAERLRGVFSAIHILPFFPYSSDDGFSVIDYEQVNPELGSWREVEELGRDFSLMFDLVLNHISAGSGWFAGYLEGAPGFEDLAIEVDPGADLSLVTRPRALPLLTEFTKAGGEAVHLWTTFSADQIDLNFASPAVLVKMIEVLLGYAARSAGYIRLDAIAYLWKKIGTTCIHLPQTHEVVRLFRAVLDLAAPDVIIITETNVPHEENTSYFGDGVNEAQMVYNFTLPPLLLHTFLNGDATVLSRWAAGLELESERNAFFNFTSSHDGIGVRPLEGILPPEEINRLAEAARACGGRVSSKTNPDGTESPYELNVTYVDALMKKGPDGRDRFHANRFLASQAIALALPGVPAVYIHSLLGSHNWNEGVAQTGRARTINRKRLNMEEVTASLEDKDSFRARVFHPYCKLIRTRSAQSAFHPRAGARILETGPQVFGIARQSGDQTVFALTNVTASPVEVDLPGQGIPTGLTDLVSGNIINGDSLVLGPYQTAWLS
ncbi:MAG: alpha-amylase family glycosyl hydrolase [Gemmatimonadota bacterium]|nr:alpha-amylase family glycosyl hydrolase [Gemmatimonadota bacterium]